MGQLIYPSSLNVPGNHIHSILFNINTIERADSTSTTPRVVENPDNAPSAMTELYKNPYSNVPILYDKSSSHFNISADISTSSDKLLAQYTRTEDSIVLQMPDNIGSSYGIEWKHSDFGSASRLSNLLWTSSDDHTQAANMLKESISSSTEQYMAMGIQKISGVNVMDVLERHKGSIINPLIETIFKGVTNRSFSFKFKFFPRNAGESQSVLDIITSFKKHMHPELIHGVKPYFKYPDTFDITFMMDDGKPSPWLFRMSTCALTSLEANDTPESKYITHEDGSPVVRELTLTFTEMEQMHKERFKHGDSF